MLIGSLVILDVLLPLVLLNIFDACISQQLLIRDNIGVMSKPSVMLMTECLSLSGWSAARGLIILLVFVPQTCISLIESCKISHRHNWDIQQTAVVFLSPRLPRNRASPNGIIYILSVNQAPRWTQAHGHCLFKDFSTSLRCFTCSSNMDLEWNIY